MKVYNICFTFAQIPNFEILDKSDFWYKGINAVSLEIKGFLNQLYL